jgi:hypothetical protein
MLEVLINNGSGSFVLSSAALQEPSHTVALAALVDSGAPLGVVTGASTLTLLVNQGGILYQDAKFTIRYPVGPDPRLLESADLDRDGHLDLLTASASEPTLSVLLGGGSGDLSSLGITLHISAPATALTIGDWNHDGLADLALLTAAPPELQVLLGSATPLSAH